MGLVNNVNGVRKESFYTPNTILFDTGAKHTFSAMVSNSGVTADESGRKIIKAGTPVMGDIAKRENPFTVVSGSVSGDCAIMFHDADVTDGNANATLLDFGNVDLNKLPDDVQTKITSDVKEALNGKVAFFK